MLCDLFANVITYHFPLWRYQETIFATNILINHSFVSIMIMLIAYPVTILIYLGKFPDGTPKKILWIILWVFIYWIIEFINLHYLNLIRHENGWSMYWSLAFNIVMFTILYIHQNKPILAWILSGFWAAIIIMTFNIPIISLLP
ncbi:CBO0543 family protein [Ornithinibacillus scapharcae]|uniref:CBO0543 family protein n=1 Tax=Ornithinibacillus scapharcae TaxID=1147159 RepID=UPI003B43CDB2